MSQTYSLPHTAAAMDFEHALPPAIRRSPAAAFEAQRNRGHRTLVFDESDEDSDEAAPPPVARSRSASIDGQQPQVPTSRYASSTDVNPLRAHPVDAEPPPRNPARQFSRPFKDIEPRRHVPSPDPVSPIGLPSTRRHPRDIISYRNNKRELSNIKRLPPHLRRQTSLETINSVTTTASEDPSEYDCDPPEAQAPSPDFFTLEHHPPCNPPPSIRSKPSSSFSTISGSSRQSSTPAETPLEYASLDHHSPQSLFRKMMPRKTSKLDKMEEVPPSPTRLVIEKTTSIDRTTRPSTHSRSTTSLQSTTTSLPEERSIQSALDNIDRSRSGSKSSGSSKWSASEFDIGTLTEAEIKKCKKKGINPALYAEMRAAKKGKWTSPIAGNTFL
jgi:hypothetical protein